MCPVLSFFVCFLSCIKSFAGTGDYDRKLDCAWKYNGCKRDGEIVLDFRSMYIRQLHEIDESYQCQGYECSDQQVFLRSFGESKNYLTESELRDIYARRGAGEKEKKEYFIPLGLSEKEKIAALASASLGLVVFTSDQEIMDFVQDNKNEVTQDVEDFGYVAGGKGLVGLAAGSYVMGAVFDNGKLKDVGILTVATGIVSQAITEAFKVGFGRVRPRNAGGDPYIFGTNSKSFFSGHASGAFGTAAVLAELYKGTAVPYVAYGVAGLVAYARMHAEGHYASDVVFGALAGYLSAKITMRLLSGDDQYGGLVITPNMRRDPWTDETIYDVGFKWRPGYKKKEFSCKEFDGQHPSERISMCIQKLFAE